MNSLRIRTRFLLNTYVVCSSAELFEDVEVITIPTGFGSTVVIPPPLPLDAPPSPYAWFLDQRHTHDSNSVLIDVIIGKAEGVSAPEETSPIDEPFRNQEHEYYPYLKHADAYARHYGELLIESLRWRTNQSWIGWGGHRSMHDRQLMWVYESEGKAKTSEDRLLIRGNTPIDLVRPGEDFKLLGKHEWRQVARDVREERRPALHDKLLLDAHYFLHGGSLRRCTLEAAIACELYARKRIRELTIAPDDPVLKDLLRPGNFADRYLHLASLYLTSRSLKEENGDLWRRIKELFQARNDAAHANEAEESVLAGDVLIPGGACRLFAYEALRLHDGSGSSSRSASERSVGYIPHGPKRKSSSLPCSLFIRPFLDEEFRELRLYGVQRSSLGSS